MKIFKYLMVCAIFMLSACELTDLDHLDNPNQVSPENAELGLFFNSVQLDFKDFFLGASDPTMEVVRMTAMTGGNTYNNSYGATTFNFVWGVAYADLLPDLNELISIAAAPENPLPFYGGAAKLMKAYVLMTVVDLFGDVPYTDAGQGVAVQNPSADADESIYAAALGLIDEAIADLARNEVDVRGDDLFYGSAGDIDAHRSLWVAFANSVKLKYLINTRLVNGDPGSEITDLSTKVIQDAAGDFQFSFGTQRANPDSRHWYYQRHYEVDGDEYLSNYYMWSLLDEKGIEDPRLRYYFYRQDLDVTDEDDFTLDCPSVPRPLHYTGDYPWCTAADNGYWGRDHGNNDGIPPDGQKKTCWGLYPGGGLFDAGQGAHVKNSGEDGAGGAGIAPIMLSSFVDFMLAEAALTTSYGGDARTHLENGVRESITKVMDFGSLAGSGVTEDLTPTMDDVDAYVTLVLNNYDGANDSGKLDIVAKEYHIALCGNGIEAYNMYRRTGFPSSMQPTRDPDAGDFPRLMFYPADYVNLNGNASQRDIKQQVFWDNNSAGFIK